MALKWFPCGQYGQYVTRSPRGDPEKLRLKWKDFQENTISAFGTLMEQKEFADVCKFSYADVNWCFSEFLLGP